MKIFNRLLSLIYRTKVTDYKINYNYFRYTEEEVKNLFKEYLKNWGLVYYDKLGLSIGELISYKYKKYTITGKIKLIKNEKNKHYIIPFHKFLYLDVQVLLDNNKLKYVLTSNGVICEKIVTTDTNCCKRCYFDKLPKYCALVNCTSPNVKYIKVSHVKYIIIKILIKLNMFFKKHILMEYYE